MDQVKSIKNVAIVVAGGSGTRMGQDIPKQFINVFEARSDLHIGKFPATSRHRCH